MPEARINVTKVTLTYFEIDVWVPAADPVGAVERKAIKLIEDDPARHQLSNVDSTYMVTSARYI